MKNEEKKEEELEEVTKHKEQLPRDYSLLQKIECDAVDQKEKVAVHNVFTIDNSPRNSDESVKVSNDTTEIAQLNNLEKPIIEEDKIINKEVNSQCISENSDEVDAIKNND